MCIVMSDNREGKLNFVAEGKCASYTAIMMCTLMTNNFEVLVRSREFIIEYLKREREGQLTELRVAGHKHQSLMEEHWNPATAAVEDVDDAMLDEMLRHMEELDEHLKQSEADEVIKDATLKKLELVNADQGRGERSVFLDMEEVNKKTIT